MSCSVAAARLERQAEPRYRTNVLPGRRSPCRMGSRGRLSTPASPARHERRPVSCLAFQRSHVPDVDEDGLRGVQSGLCLAQAQRANAGVGVVDELPVAFGDGHRVGFDVGLPSGARRPTPGLDERRWPTGGLGGRNGVHPHRHRPLSRYQAERFSSGGSGQWAFLLSHCTMPLVPSLRRQRWADGKCSPGLVCNSSRL